MENGRGRRDQRTTPPVNGIRRRKLVLHFDVRNTILVADSVTNVLVEEAVNSYLTGVTWGRETGNTWQWVSDKPSPYAPCDDCITYYKHREKELVKTPSDRAVLREVTGDFTQEPLGERFYPYFSKILNELRWPHPKHPDPQLTMLGRQGNLYHYILPSFFNLIQYLHDDHRDFAVVLRTYGLDAPNVLESIDYSFRGNHPRFKSQPLPYPVHKTPGRVIRTDDSITLESHLASGVVSISNERDIYEALSATEGVAGYVDDFQYWQDNQYNFSTAKPHWIDPFDDTVQHIFFDDNLRVEDVDSIVNVRVFPQRRGQGEAESVSREHMRKLQDVCLVMADLLESTADLDYFINKVKKCEAGYEAYVQQMAA
jgi:hypothetical protein